MGTNQQPRILLTDAFFADSRDGGGGTGSRQYYDVVLEAGDALDSFPNQYSTYSYADYLANGQESSPPVYTSTAAGVAVDVAEVEKFLTSSRPRTWRDAYPLYVAAKAVLRAQLQGKLTLQSSAMEAKEAERVQAVGAAASAIQRERDLQSKYDVLSRAGESSYLRLTKSFDERQATNQAEAEAQLAALQGRCAAELGAKDKELQKKDEELQRMADELSRMDEAVHEAERAASAARQKLATTEDELRSQLAEVTEQNAQLTAQLEALNQDGRQGGAAETAGADAA